MNNTKKSCAIAVQWTVRDWWFLNSLVLILMSPALIACKGYRANPTHTPQITSASFVGTDKAWITTFIDGQILRTDNSGESWTKVGVDGVRFDQVAFVDQHQGWAVSSDGRVWRTSTSGTEWTVVGAIPSSTAARYHKAQHLYFSDDTHGWIIDAFSGWCTTDGGSHWSRCFHQGVSSGSTGWPKRYFQVDSKAAWITATDGEVYRTLDGGRTWQRKKIAGDAAFRGIFFLNERDGWVTGWPNGGIYRTFDGGNTWRQQLAETKTNNIAVDSIFFIDEHEGWAVGRLWPIDIANDEMRPLVLHTSDGGQTWKSSGPQGNELFFSSVHFSDSEHGWLISRDNVYKSEDRGKTWRVVLSLPPIQNR